MSTSVIFDTYICEAEGHGFALDYCTGTHHWDDSSEREVLSQILTGSSPLSYSSYAPSSASFSEDADDDYSF